MNVNETYYTIQPTPYGMPRSIKELREALGMLSKSRLHEIVITEATSNNDFAGKVFDAHEKEIYMQLNTNYDFDHLARRVEQEITMSKIYASFSDKERVRVAENVKFQIAEASIIDSAASRRQRLMERQQAIATMKTKAIAEYASPGTKTSALFTACAMLKQIFRVKREHFLHAALKDSRGQLTDFMREILGVLGVQELDEMVKETQGSLLRRLLKLGSLAREEADAGLEELIDLLTTKVDDSSETDEDEDSDGDEDMREDTPTTPQPGSAMSVLFMDD